MKIERIKVPPLVDIPKPMKILLPSDYKYLLNSLKRMIEKTSNKIEGL